MVRPPDLLYAVDETPPPAILVASALQHVAVIAITLIFPLILGEEARLSRVQFLDLVSLSMIAIGVATILFCIRSRFVGSGYLCPACYTAIYLGPSLFALKEGGLGLVFGMTMVAGLVQVAIAPILQRVRVLMPSEIAGLVIAIVGLSLAALGVQYMLGITATQGIRHDYLVISAVSLATMTALNVWAKGYAKMFCVLIGMAVGYAASAALGVLDFSAAMPSGGVAILRLPSTGFISYRFDILALAPFVVAAFASTLRVMGDVTNCQRINDKDWVRPNFASLAGGVAANGLASIICGLAGSLGPNSYSSCIGLSAATGITSRTVGYVVGVAFIVLALVPAVTVLFAAMPPPVMGAALFFTAAFVFTSGLQIITARMLDARKTMVIGFSFAMAVMADIYHNVFMQAPAVLQPIVGSSLVLGTVCAVALNLIMRVGVRQRVTIKLEAGQHNREAVEQFLTEQGSRWAARRDVVNRAIFGAVQVLEVIGNPPEGVALEASFDEFNLDLRMRYKGDPLTIPEKRPSPREILSSDEGERLLAGYLLRRSADRISSTGIGPAAEIHLHYDH
ncbi:MAG: solute carrier family 23 protein [Xanthobacteraceae bacterium]